MYRHEAESSIKINLPAMSMSSPMMEMGKGKGADAAHVCCSVFDAMAFLPCCWCLFASLNAVYLAWDDRGRMT